jgi:UDP-3-O-acyl-N-acetylglucosamine deacetylase
MVDMVGDLALAGCDLAGRFVAYRSGHRLNAELVRALVAEVANDPVAEKQPLDKLQRCA